MDERIVAGEQSDFSSVPLVVEMLGLGVVVVGRERGAGSRLRATTPHEGHHQ